MLEKLITYSAVALAVPGGKSDNGGRKGAAKNDGVAELHFDDWSLEVGIEE